MARFMLVCLDSSSQVELTNADVLNLLWGLKYADAAAGDVQTEYAGLHERLADTFKGDVK